MVPLDSAYLNYLFFSGAPIVPIGDLQRVINHDLDSDIRIPQFGSRKFPPREAKKIHFELKTVNRSIEMKTDKEREVM